MASLLIINIANNIFAIFIGMGVKHECASAKNVCDYSKRSEDFNEKKSPCKT